MFLTTDNNGLKLRFRGDSKLEPESEHLPPPEYMNVRQTASYIGFSVQRLNSWRQRGIGPPWIKVHGADGRDVPNGTVRYRRSDVDRWMTLMRREST